jgi:hypothetical protein
MTVPLQLTTRVRRALAFVAPLHVSPDGRWLFVSSEYGARIFDAAAPAEAAWSCSERVSAMVAAGPWIVCALAKPARLIVLRASELSQASETALAASAAHMAIDAAGSRIAMIDKDGALHRITLDEAGCASIDTLPGEPYERAALALSADGRMAVMTAHKRDARSCPVQVIDLDTMSITHTLKGARAEVIELAIGPAGTILAATFGLVMAWASVKAKGRTILKCKSYPNIIGFADPDHVILLDHRERAVCVALADDAIVWEHPNYGPASLSAGRLVHNRFSAIYWREPLTGALLGEVSAPPHPWQLTLDPTRDVVHVATSAGALIRTWQLGAAALDPIAEGNGGKVLCLACDAAQRWLALGTAEGIVLLVDQHDLGAPPRVFARPSASSTAECTALCLDPERDHLWAAIDDRIIRWCLSTGELEAQSERQKDEISAMSPLTDRGVLVLTARARRRSYGELSVLDLATLDTLHDQRLSQTVTAIERAGADQLTLRSAYGAMRFDLHTNTLTALAASEPLPLSVQLLVSPATPRGVRVTSTHNRQTNEYDYTLQLWSTGEDAQALGEPFACPGIAVPPQWRGDGACFVIVHHDHALRVWDGETGQLRETISVGVHSPRLLSILPDGRRAVVAGYDGSCELVALPA